MTTFLLEVIVEGFSGMEIWHATITSYVWGLSVLAEDLDGNWYESFVLKSALVVRRSWPLSAIRCNNTGVFDVDRY